MSSRLYAPIYKLSFMGEGLSERVERIIREQGIWPAELARIAGVSSSTVMQWRNGQTAQMNISNAIPIARKYGYRADWIATGELPVFQGEGRGGRLSADVPLTTWIQAGNNHFSSGDFLGAEVSQWLICPVPHSDKTFALRVEGDSMTTLTGKSFPAGIDIFVDPEQAEDVKPGDLVVARLEESGATTFKRLAEEDGRSFLRPLNPNYPPIFDEFKLIGKVIYAGFEP